MFCFLVEFLLFQNQNQKSFNVPQTVTAATEYYNIILNVIFNVI